MTGREQAIAAAGAALAAGIARRDSLDPRAAAEEAWYLGNRYSVDELEDMIRASRGLPPLHQGPTDTSSPTG